MALEVRPDPFRDSSSVVSISELSPVVKGFVTFSVHEELVFIPV